MEEKETIQISGKAIAVVFVLILLLVSTFGMLALNGKDKSISSNGESNDLPEKCRVPAGQDIDSWKEHLGHHAETKDCLKYFK